MHIAQILKSENTFDNIPMLPKSSLYRIATEAMADIKRMNNKMELMDMDNALLIGSGAGAYNIYSDTGAGW